jgi:quinol monooxygenase YgiN
MSTRVDRMPVMVVTRLRLRRPELLDDFFVASVAVIEQAKAASGSLGVDAMAENNDVWWTVSAWQDRAAMRAFVAAEPHHSVIPRVDEFCDEATFVDWEQDSAELPAWDISYARLVAEGQSAALTDASPANQDRSFPPPPASA